MIFNIFLFSNDDAKKTYGIYENKSTSSIISTDTSNAIKDINANIIGTDKEYINNESLVLSNGETKNTFVKKIPILFNNNKQILAVRIDLTEREKLLRAQRLVSTSLPSLNAFTWSIDGRDETIEFGSTVELVGVSIEDINSINKCSRYIHPEDKHIFINALRIIIE